MEELIFQTLITQVMHPFSSFWPQHFVKTLNLRFGWFAGDAVFRAENDFSSDAIERKLLRRLVNVAFVLPFPSSLSVELHRCAVFCLLQLGGEIFDTDMVIVDRTLTDICFDNTIVL